MELHGFLREAETVPPIDPDKEEEGAPFDHLGVLCEMNGQ